MSGPDLTDADFRVDKAKPSVAVEAEGIINGPRRDAYGPVRESFQRIADLWSPVVGVPITCEQVAAMMVLLKVARELGGQHHRDNLVDICGYALLWDRLAEGHDDLPTTEENSTT